MNQIPEWILTSGPPNVAKPTKLMFAVDPGTGDIYYWDMHVWRPCAGGGCDFPNPNVIWVSGSAPAGGDGKFCTPFQTVQEGVDAAPLGEASTIMVGPGTYTEDLAFNGTRRVITLCGIGAWRLVGSITWTLMGSPFPPQPRPPYPVLWITSLTSNTANDGLAAAGTGAVIDGSIGLAAPHWGGPTGTLGGTFLLTGSIQASGPVDFRGLFYRCNIQGAVSARGSIIVEAEDTFFGDTVTVSSAGRLSHCTFGNGFTYSGATSPRFYDCTIFGTLTGGGPVLMDATTYDFFRRNAATFSGGAFLELLGVFSGTTANRPVTVTVGCPYFDTSLTPPRPIWWDGSQWVDATGAAV